MTPCIHFGICGGCSLQNLSPDEYRAHKRQQVVDALARVGLNQVAVEEPVLVPLRSRRRAVFKFGKTGAQPGKVATGFPSGCATPNNAVEIGFHAAKSHAIIDMRECLVLRGGLFDLAQFLRGALAPILKEGEKGEVHVTETETGLDLAFRWNRKLTPALTASFSQALARLPRCA